MNKLLFCCVAILLAALAYVVPMDCLLVREDMPRLFLTMATLSTTLFGFVFTGLSFLLSLNKEILINNMKKTGLYESLIIHLYSCAFMFLFTMLVSITSFFVKNINWWKFNFVVFVLGVYILAFIGKTFIKIVMLVSKPTGNPNVLDVEKIE